MIKFEAALTAVADAQVDCVIVGGIAAMLHGAMHFDVVLDICYSRSAANLERLAKALAPFHPRPRGMPPELPFVWDVNALRNGWLFTLSTDLGDIDLLPEIAGIGDFDAVKTASKPVEMLGQTFQVLSVRALIAAKRAAGRPKDLQAIPELQALLEAEEA